MILNNLLQLPFFNTVYSQGPAAGSGPEEARWPRLEGDPCRRGSNQLGPRAELHREPERRYGCQCCPSTELHPRALLYNESHYNRQDVCYRTHFCSQTELHHRAHSHQPHHPEVFSYLWGPDCQSGAGKQCIGNKHEHSIWEYQMLKCLAIYVPTLRSLFCNVDKLWHFQSFLHFKMEKLT